MSDDPTNKHLHNLVAKIQEDVSTKLQTENDSSNVLLKGHLLIENLLDEVLAAFDLRPDRGWRAGFHDKVSTLNKIVKNEELKSLHKLINEIVPLLFSLNDVRNDLAHNIRFSLSESSVNQVGMHLGSAYVLVKYESGHAEIRKNLVYCLETAAWKLGLILFNQIETLKRKQAEQAKAQQKPAVN